jgi:hypothetical protein
VSFENRDGEQPPDGQGAHERQDPRSGRPPLRSSARLQALRCCVVSGRRDTQPDWLSFMQLIYRFESNHSIERRPRSRPSSTVVLGILERESHCHNASTDSPAMVRQDWFTSLGSVGSVVPDVRPRAKRPFPPDSPEERIAT